MSPKSKKKALSQEECKTMVLEYLKKEYRPYAVTDLVLNLHNQISRSNMDKVLGQLMMEEQIMSKTYGKSTYYCYRELAEQEQAESVNATVDMVKQSKEELLERQASVAEKKKELALYESRISVEELKVKIKTNKQRIEELRSDINKAEGEEHSQYTLKAADEIKKQHELNQKRFDVYCKVYRGIISTIMDSTEDYKALLEAIGVEEVPEL